MLAKRAPISQLVKALPQRYTHSDRLQEFATEKSHALVAMGARTPKELLKQLGLSHLEVDSANDTDGLRLTLSDGSIIHLRPSGNAPELRCYAEADEFNLAYDYVSGILKRIKEFK